MHLLATARKSSVLSLGVAWRSLLPSATGVPSTAAAADISPSFETAAETATPTYAKLHLLEHSSCRKVQLQSFKFLRLHLVTDWTMSCLLPLLSPRGRLVCHFPLFWALEECCDGLLCHAKMQLKVGLMPSTSTCRA